MRYTIENEYLKAEVSELGATLTRFIDKKTGKDIVLGFDTDEEYIANNGSNIGASIGRNANRIGNARFELNGETYELSVNDNMNQLHGGGVNGFAFKTWKVEELKDDEIVLSYFSRDLEEGFPGNLEVKVSYRLEGNSLVFAFEGTSDKDTVFNMTNHSYFNLGEGQILDDLLHVTTDRYSPTDQYALTLDEVDSVEGTPYDFTTFRRIGDNVKQLPTGIDNNYVWEDLEDKLMCELKNDALQLNVYSDLPDMHVYTAYHLKTDSGKYGKQYGSYMGICLECQYYPNGINYGDRYLLPILRKGETMSHYIRFELKGIRED
ncbi:MAG: galactose mutarotase [Erysipelotrichaceae bacterium]|nr:galactose mutarotase [Erysipelotrichaceae bacterium]